MMRDFINDLGFAFRRLLKNPGFTITSVGSLSVGLAIAATTLATVDAYLLQTPPYPNARSVYHLRYAPPGPWEPRGMTGIDWSSLGDVVEDTIVSSGATFHLMDAGSPRRTRALQVSPGFLRGLGIQPVMGRSFNQDEFRPGAEAVAVIGYHLWRDRFNSDPQIVGRLVQVTQEDRPEQIDSVRIVGVLPPGFWFGRDSTANVDLLTPLRAPMRTYMVRLREGVAVSWAEKRITDVARSIGSDFRPDWSGVHLESVHARYVEGIRPVLFGVSIAVGVVLLLACANVAVLVLLRTLRRQKEVAVRVALGAERKHILRMVVAEAGLLCGAALATGVALSSVALGALTPFIEAQLGRPAPNGPATIRLDATVLLALAAACVVIAFALGLIPLLAPWQRRLAGALRSQEKGSTDDPRLPRLRASLIAVEVAGCLVLLAACGSMIRSTLNLMRADLGFDPEQVLRVGVRLPARAAANAPALHRFFTSLTDRLPHDPDSRIALMSAFPPFYPANTQAFEAAETASDEAPAGMLRVGAGYFALYRVRIKEGREFTSADRLGTEPVAVISESLARRLWPDSAALGRQLRVVEGDTPGSTPGPWRTIVGVVGDIRQGYEDSDPRDIYLPFLQAPIRFASVHIRTGRSPGFWEERVRAAVAELDSYALAGPAVPIVAENRQLAGTQFLTLMLAVFGGFAALLAVLGIYGVTSYAAQQRSREIAVRMALGADRDVVVRMFLTQGGRILWIGVALGCIGAFGAAGVLKNRVYGVDAFDPATLLAAVAFVAATGLLSIWWPARRATGSDPLMALRSE